jgi:hydroxyacylglutathione hydrolase
MFLERVESKGLAHYSYVIGDESAGLCAVIDPRRYIDEYLEIARRRSCRIAYALETHIHADFVSGATELAARTGAEIIVGREGEYGFKHTPVSDDDMVRVGKVTLRALHTPGHTPEHICYLAGSGEDASEPWAVFTGDTLFASEVGRPDLLGEATQRKLASQLYHSLTRKLLALGDEITILPAHGKGSPCGGSIGDRPATTIGYERRYNERLRPKSEEEFVTDLLTGLPPAPTYYPRLKEVNAAGPAPLGCLAETKPMPPAEFEEQANDALILDIRSIEAFAGAHLANSLNIGYLENSFAMWAGWMLRPDQRILFVANDPEEVSRARIDLLEVGIENVAGYLQDGIRGWVESARRFVHSHPVSVHELKRLSEDGDTMQILDVRSPGEWQQGHVRGAIHTYVPFLEQQLDGRLDRNKPVVTYCGTGYRASIAASTLERMGFHDVRIVPGSMMAWKAADYPLETP